MSKILCVEKNVAGIVTLDRPEALNALSVEMLEALYHQLDVWQANDAIQVIVITSSSPRAFCAGGDVLQAVSEIKAAGGAPALQYFRTEYGIHAKISNLSKPVICLVNGIIMGGGLGLARNSGNMIVSDKIKLAMPETAIGLFPDVAANIFLRTAGLPAALMMGMTGTIIGAGDALAWGIADHHVPATAFDDLIVALSLISHESEIASLIDACAQDAPEVDLAGDMTEIERCFSGTVAEISAKLDTSTHPMAQNWRSALKTRCPASIAAIHYMLHQPTPKTVEEALNTDFKLALNMTARPDFVDGVRAILIDKDNQPKWAPSRLAQIDDNFIESLFDFDGLPDLQDTAVST